MWFDVGMPTDPVPPTPALLEILERSRELGFLGPGSVEAHVDHAGNFVGPLQHRRRVVDLGSGGGVPGLVLATVLPDLQVTLLDAMQKRCRFLEWAVAELGLDVRARVLCGRAEDLARAPEERGGYEAVVSRSFAGPAVTVECAVGFLAGPGSRIVISEPPDHPARWPDEPLAVLGLRVGDRAGSASGSVQVLDVLEACPDRFPRRTGIPAKRPLF